MENKIDILDLEIKRLQKESTETQNKRNDIEISLSKLKKQKVKEFLKENKKTFPLEIGDIIQYGDVTCKISHINFIKNNVELDLITIKNKYDKEFNIELISTTLLYYYNFHEKSWLEVFENKRIKVISEISKETKLLNFIWENGYYNDNWEFCF